jgi:Zn-dependent protease with chaperone function/uncharacterized tellurite resistance protein B-like protein
MDFFERQEQARRGTQWLLFYFAGGVVALILAVYLAVAIAFNGLSLTQKHRHRVQLEQPELTLWNSKLFLGVAIGTLVVIGAGSAYKTAELAQGGTAVASMLGGRLINPATSDPDERKLLNVVEEMAIASGIPVPQVFLLPGEAAINAFAAGHSPSDAVIGVTAGALKLLTRDELQGVIGHEFSHVLNGDMRLNLRLMGLLFGILCLAVIGRVLLECRGRSSRDRNPLPMLGLLLIAIGWIGVFFGRLIQAAISRKREVLADASAVQFTRNPAGLAGALKKIGGCAEGSRIRCAQAQEASHLFFGNGMGESFLGLMQTHPPLLERIRALDPAFDGRFPRVEAPELTGRPDLEAPFLQAAAFISAPSSATRPTSPPRFPAPPRLTNATAILPSLGTPGTDHLRYAANLNIPPVLNEAARDAMGASALVYALLLSTDPPIQGKQLEALTSITSSAMRAETLRLLPAVQQVATHAKLPLVDLALPGLRALSDSQYQQFRKAVAALVEADGEIDLFEYVLQRVVLRHLEPHFAEVRMPTVQYYAAKPLAPDCSVLLSALAHCGHDDPAQIQKAFAFGAERLSYHAQAPLSLLPHDQCDLAQIDASLDRLAAAVPQIRKNVLVACADTVAADGVIREEEAELLRAIADSLECPIPPLLAAAGAEKAQEPV